MRILKNTIIAAIVFLIWFDIGTTDSARFDFYDNLGMFTNFVYARYDFPIESIAFDDKGLEAGYWVWEDSQTLVGPFNKPLTHYKTQNPSDLPWATLDRRYPQSCPPSMAGDIITYRLRIKAAVDSMETGDDTLAIGYIRWISEERVIRELPIGYLMSNDPKRKGSSVFAVFLFELSDMLLGNDYKSGSARIQVALKTGCRNSFRIEWIKIYDEMGFRLVESADYLNEVRDYMRIIFEIDGRRTIINPGPEYPLAHMIMTGDFDGIMREYRYGWRLKLRSFEF